jgi:hypothetical protein
LAEERTIHPVKVSIGNTEVTDTSQVYWPYTAGTDTAQLQITLPNMFAEALYRRPIGGVDLIIESGQDKIHVKGLSCIDIERDNYLKSTATIVDYRFFLRYLKWVGRYNMRRIVNKFELVPNAPEAAKNWWMFPDYTWLYWSVKGGTPPSWKDQEPAKGVPYTTLEISEIICNEIFGDLYGGVFESDKYDHAAPDNLEFMVEPVQGVLDRMLEYARAEIGFFPKLNKFYIFAIDDDYGWDKRLLELQEKFRTESDLSGVEVHEYKHLTPTQIKIISRKEREVVIEVGDKNIESLPAGEAQFIYPPVRNVTQITRNMTVNGKFYAKNTYCEISDMLTELGIKEAEVREKWRTPLVLYEIYAKKRGYAILTFAAEHPLEAQLLNNLKRDYRTLYRIDPAWISQVVSLKPVRSSYVDRVSQTRQQSHVFANYSFSYLLRLGAEYVKRKGVNWGEDVFHAPYGKSSQTIIKNADNEAPVESTAINSKISNWEVSVVSEELGVIKFSPIPDLEAQVVEYFPSILDNMPKLAIQRAPLEWTLCRLNQRHRIITVLSAIFAYPNDFNQFHVTTLNVEDLELGYPEGDYPKPWEFFSPRINARVDYTGNLVNRELIEILAKAEAIKALRRVRPRLEGSVKLAGYYRIPLFGYCKEIRYSCDRGGIKTQVTIPPSPPEVELYSLLGQSAKKIFFELEA